MRPVGHVNSYRLLLIPFVQFYLTINSCTYQRKISDILSSGFGIKVLGVFFFGGMVIAD